MNVTLFVIARNELLPVMTHLEVERIEAQLELGYADLYQPIETLANIAEDYAAWDETYAFIEAPSEAYIRSNIVKSTFVNFGLSFFVFINQQGEVVHDVYYVSGSESLRPVSEGLLQELLQESRLWTFADADQLAQGFYQLDDKIYGLVSHPIVSSNGEGPSRGALIVGLVLDEDEFVRIGEDWGHDIDIKLLQSDFHLDAVGPDASIHPYDVRVKDNETLVSRIHVRDIFGRPLMDVVSHFKRDFFTHGKIILETMLRWNLIICLAFAVICYLVVDKAFRSREKRIESDEQYRKLSDEFETILDGIPNPLTLISPDLNVLWVNKAGSELLADVAPAESGKYISRVEFISGFAEGVSAVERCLLSKKTERYEAELPDGRVLEEYAYPIKDADDGILSIIRLVVDVTEATYLKREANQNSRLASIGELAAGVAHEINNPTGMLLLNLDLMSDVFSDFIPVLDGYHANNPDFEPGRIPYATLRKKMPYLLKEMTDAGLRIKRIVEDLKGFVRAEEATKVEAVDVNEVADAAQRLVGYQLRKATGNFTFSRGEGLPPVRGHFRRLEQVVVNLLVNATQALDDRSGGICLSTRLSEDGRWVLIEVQDQGKGVDPAIIDKITDPFFTTRRNDGGTGLGLSLSSRIAEEHSGSIRIYSKVGQGSLVSLQLPCYTEKS